jgi:Ala-tRNA(Pro) deacylase
MSEQPTPLLADGSPPATAATVLEKLAELGIESVTADHPPVFTVEEAKALRGALEGAHTKNLFVRDKKGAMCLVVALEDRRIEMKELAGRIGLKRLSFGSADRLMKYLGVIPGAVTPFGVVNDHGGLVSVALDRGLKDHELWNFHPVDNAKTTTLRGEDMVRFLEAVDHPPTWVDL